MFFLIAFVTVPFTSILVRYRLAYHPKEVPANAADPEADACGQADSKEPRETVMTKPTFLSVAKRIYQIEGRNGFYKAIIPTLIVNFVMWINARNYLTRLYISPNPSTLTRTLSQSLVGTLFYSFALVWIYRAIATRSKLEVFGTSIKDGVRTLFTHFERTRPHRIVTPSLLSALVGQIILQRFVFHPLELMVPDHTTNGIDTIYFLSLSACYKLVLLIVNTLICAPLDVIVTRLAVQLNHGSSHTTTEAPLGTNMAAHPVEVDGKSTPESNDNLAVRYRGDDLELYTSVYDCAMKIIKEEGWTVLYRGWFITFLGKVYS